MNIAQRCRAIGLAAAVAGATIVVPLGAAPAEAHGGGLAQQALAYCKSIREFVTPTNLVGACESYFVSHYKADGLPAAESATNAYFCKSVFVPAGEFPTVGICVSVLFKERKSGSAG